MDGELCTLLMRTFLIFILDILSFASYISRVEAVSDTAALHTTYCFFVLICFGYIYYSPNIWDHTKKQAAYREETEGTDPVLLTCQLNQQGRLSFACPEGCPEPIGFVRLAELK